LIKNNFVFRQAIAKKFIHIDLSRVRKRENIDLKTGESHRSMAIRPLYSEPDKKMRQSF
jgi:hypothetical protein